MIKVTFTTSEGQSTDWFEGTIDELIIDLLTGGEEGWPCTLVEANQNTLTFVRINTNDQISFAIK